MATASERYKIALNILSRVGIDGNLHDEYAKAMSGINRFDSYNQMQANAPMPDINATAIPDNAGGTIIPPTGQSTTQVPMV